MVQTEFGLYFQMSMLSLTKISRVRTKFPYDYGILKGSSDSSQFIFEINVGKSRIRHRTNLKLNSLTDSKSIEDDII